jgi:cyclic beta-1,2-glucan synthetase
MWAILAFTELGEADKAAELFAMLNPINHARTPEEVERYKVEPYVVAADLYSVAPHVGRGGWTWYTGAAGWMYRAGLEGMLGIRREGASLVVKPCMPSAWPSFEAQVCVDAAAYHIRVENLAPGNQERSHALLDGTRVEWSDDGVRAPLDGHPHALRIFVANRQTLS